MITANGEEVAETRTEWIIRDPENNLVSVLPEIDYDQEEAEMLAALSGCRLKKRTLLVLAREELV